MKRGDPPLVDASTRLTHSPLMRSPSPAGVCSERLYRCLPLRPRNLRKGVDLEIARKVVAEGEAARDHLAGVVAVVDGGGGQS
jgi:hypothetical protein